jgi:hypothetical protein
MLNFRISNTGRRRAKTEEVQARKRGPKPKIKFGNGQYSPVNNSQLNGKSSKIKICMMHHRAEYSPQTLYYMYKKQSFDKQDLLLIIILKIDNFYFFKSIDMIRMGMNRLSILLLYRF